MKAAVGELLAEIAEANAWTELKNVTLAFLHTPAYSPKFNPAEYLIHLVRQDALYHLPCTFTLQDKADRVQAHLARPAVDSRTNAEPPAPYREPTHKRETCEKLAEIGMTGE